MWLLPSRRRPANLARFFSAFRGTGGTTPGIVIVDRHDWEDLVAAYGAIQLPPGWSWIVTAGETQGDKIREIWDQVKDCAWLGLIGDDCVPETLGWDQALVQSLNGHNFVSCDDGWQAPKRVGNCWLISGAVIRAVGYLFPPGLQHLYVDDVWEEIGRQANCWRLRMGVRVIHRHVLAGDAEADDTHRLVYGSDTSDPMGGLWPQDRAAYEAWREHDMARGVAAVMALQPARGAAAAQRLLMIATPLYRDPGFEYHKSMIETVMACQGMIGRIEYDRDNSNLPRARNQLVATFLGSDCTDLLFVDADMEWHPDAVHRLMASPHKVIGAVGRRKREKPAWCCQFINAPGEPVPRDKDGMIEVKSVGTGFLRIRREAFEAIIAARPDLKREGDDAIRDREHFHKFFRFGDGDEGEDYEFCSLYRSVGGQIWIDPFIPLGHVGRRNFIGRFADELRPVKRSELAPAA